jgi:hypothetical protein
MAEKPIKTANRIEFVVASSFAAAQALHEDSVLRRFKVVSQPMNSSCSRELEMRRQKT